LFLLSASFPASLRGLTAAVTCGVFLRALTDDLMAFEYFESVSLPLSVATTSGFDPYAWLGKRSLRRSVALWLPVPGRVTLLVVSEPAPRAAITSPTTNTSHSPRTTKRQRAHAWPSP
jgi:hypothetical protein